MSYEEMQAAIRIDNVIDFLQGLSELSPDDAASYEFVVQNLEEAKAILGLS